MKRIIGLLLFLTCFKVQAQFVNIPDTNLRNKLISLYPSCFNGSQQLDTTCIAIVTEDTLILSSLNLINLSGVQYFDQLVYLQCDDNQLTTISGLPSSLKYFDCYFNQINTLPVLPNVLEFLNISSNQLNSLPALPNSLLALNCSVNQLSTLPALPNSLLTLNCSNNQLSSLPALPNSLLTLWCGMNPQSSLPDLPVGLRTLACGSMKLSTLPALPATLRILNCDDNNLTRLPTLPNLINTLNCSMNQLTSFPSFPDSLGWLMCYGNDLLTCFPLFPPHLSYLNYGSTTGITCVPNLPPMITWPYPVCPSGSPCEPHPNASGIVFEDINANGLYDTLVDHLVSNRLISSSNNRISTTSVYGQYQIKLDSGVVNTFKLSPLMPYFIITPSDYNVTPASLGSQGTQYNFAIQAIAGIQDLKVNIASGRARPGFDQWIAVNVNNLGTTTISNCTLKVLKPLGFTFINANPVISTQQGDTLIWNGVNIGASAHPDFKLSWKIPATALLGDTFQIHSWLETTTLDSTPTNNHCVLTNVFQGSMDPNDKTVSKSLLTPMNINDELIYTVRFQNTGTDTAFNVVIKDELSEHLDRSSFQMIGASHDYTYQIRDNGLLEVFFQQIELPDSTINEPLSHGYFQYSARPQASLSPHDTIFNMASIYFDFNSPVNTNTVNSQLQYPSLISALNTLNANVFPNPTSGETTFTFSEPSGLLSITDLNARELFRQKINSKSTIDLSAFASGIYIAKIITSKGHAVIKIVKD